MNRSDFTEWIPQNHTFVIVCLVLISLFNPQQIYGLFFYAPAPCWGMYVTDFVTGLWDTEDRV